MWLYVLIHNTVISRYLELGYLEFGETRSVYVNKKYILIALSNQNLALETFLQVQITRVQINFTGTTRVTFNFAPINFFPWGEI